MIERPIRGPTLRGRSDKLLLLLALGTMTSIGARLVLPPLLPAIIEQLTITPSLAGIALTVSWSLYALVHYPAGRLSDQLSPNTVILAGLTLTIFGSTVLLLTGSYASFVLGTAILGVGAGLYLPAVYALTSELFPQRVGSVFGIISASINLGGALVPGLAVVVIAMTTWNVAYVPIIFVLVLVLATVNQLNQDPYVVSWIDLEVHATVKRVFGPAQSRWAVVAISLVAFVWQGFSSFLPAFLQISKGFSPPLANGAFAGVFVIGMIVNPFSGRFGDRWGYKTIVIGMAVFATFGIGLMLVASSLPVVFVGVALSAVGLAGVWPVINAYVIGLFPDSTYAGDFGAARTAFLGFGSLGSTYIGITVEHSNYATAFSGLIVCLLLSIGIWIVQTYWV